MAPSRTATAPEKRRGVVFESEDNSSTFLVGVEGLGAVGERWSRTMCQQVCTMGFIYTAVAYWWKQNQRQHAPGYE